MSKDIKAGKLSNIKNAILRNDLSSFIQKSFHTVNPATPYLHNWHIDLIAEHLRACESGEIKRLIINIPPRYLKSLCVNVAWPAWLLGHNPARRVISSSYSMGLSVKHSLDCRLVIGSDWYRDIFPETELAGDQNEKAKFVTTARGMRLATSVGGTVTGEGGNFLIVDDPHNPAEIFSDTKRKATLDWFEQTFSSRLDDKKNGVFVIIMQRLHQDDLSGYLLAKGGWEHLCLPAISEQRSPPLLHPERENVKQLEQVKRDLGSYAFAAQYQQNPAPVGGSMIKATWLKRYKSAPENARIIQSWDTAIKAGKSNDYSVCTSWAEGEDGYYLLDVMRAQIEYPDLKRRVVSLAEKWTADAILIEDKASGQSLLQDLRRETRLPLIAINPTSDKVTRLAAVSALFEAGKVFLPEYAPWLADYESELLAFPSTSHDDQTDSTSQFLQWAKSRTIARMNVRRL